MPGVALLLKIARIGGKARDEMLGEEVGSEWKGRGSLVVEEGRDLISEKKRRMEIQRHLKRL